MKIVIFFLFLFFAQIKNCFAQKQFESVRLYTFAADSIKQRFANFLIELEDYLIVADGDFIILNEVKAIENVYYYMILSGDKLLENHSIWGVLDVGNAPIYLTGNMPFWLRPFNGNYPIKIHDPKDEILEIIEERVVLAKFADGKFEILRLLD
jgi:hypothetical protein